MNRKQTLAIIGFIILLFAIPITMYLVRQQQILKSRASFVPKAEFIDAQGNVITTTNTSSVRLKITKEQVVPSPSPAVSPSAVPTAVPSPSPVASPSPVSSPSPAASPQTSPSPVSTSNLLINPGFENELSSWTCQGAVSGTCDIDSTVKFSGNSAVKVTSTGGSWGWQVSQAGISATPGEAFCLSARVKKQSTISGTYIAIQEVGRDFQGQAAVHANNDITDWQIVKDTRTVGPDWVVPIQMYLRVVNGSVPESVWFDDVSLTRGACS